MILSQHFSPRASVITVLSTHQCISSHLWLKSEWSAIEFSTIDIKLYVQQTHMCTLIHY